VLLVHILPVLFELAQVISQLVDFVSSMLFEFRLRHHARFGKMVVDCVVAVLDALQMIRHGVVSVLKLLLLLTEDVGLVA